MNATETLQKQTEAINQQLSTTQNSPEVTTTSVTPKQGLPFWRADDAMTISASVLAFGLIILCLMTMVLRKTNIHPEAVLRLFCTITIVIGALFLVVAGYSQDQMGPVMGLLGTIAGYLLGKSSSESKT